MHGRLLWLHPTVQYSPCNAMFMHARLLHMHARSEGAVQRRRKQQQGACSGGHHEVTHTTCYNQSTPWQPGFRLK
jgi:hypothetical protein